jgi:signal peptidase II
VLGGALGNLVDRIFRAPGPLQGHVVDMVSLFAPDGRVWPVFNLADSSIVSGGALLVLLAMLGRELDGTRTKDRRESDGAANDEAAKDEKDEAEDAVTDGAEAAPTRAASRDERAGE